MRKFIIYLLFFILGVYYPLYSQQGNKYIHNFTPFDYKASDQNWCSVQDKDGIMYFANLNGVLIYDGKFWKTIRLPNGVDVYSLAINHKNEVFVGADNEFGVIVKMINGEFIYKSLSSNLKQTEKDFTNIWATYCINDDVFFCANERIFRYYNNQISLLSPDKDRFHTFFKLNNHLFVREAEVGFKVFENDQLRFVLGSELFSNLKVYSILPKGENNFIVASRNGGLFNLLFNENHPSQSVLKKATSTIDKWLNDNELYCGRKIDDNHYAFGSLKNGVIIVDSNYTVTSSINSNNGLQDDAVKHMFLDANSNLWLSLNNGLSFFENSTPISFWSKQDGVTGTVENSIKFKNQLFISTDKGLKKYNQNTKSFIETEITAPCYLLSKSQEKLYITSDEGTYSYNGKQFDLINDETSYSCFYNQKNNQLYIGTDNALLILNSKNEIIKRYDDIGAVRSIVFDEDGNCGLGTSKNGVYIIFPNLSILNVTNKEGLPSLAETNVFILNGKLFFSTEHGFYEYNYTSKKAQSSTTLGIANKLGVINAFQINDEVWFQSTRSDKMKERVEEINIISNKNGKYEFVKSSLNRIQNSSIKQFLLDSNTVYIASNHGLYSYELNNYKLPIKFNVVLSRVWFGNDTINFLENYTSNFNYSLNEIEFAKNELHIYPAATSFFESNKLEFSYYLEGKEPTFKDWVTTNKIEYNNLTEKNYTFHIKARDIFGNETSELTFTFKILPPWYRTIWSYVLYLLVIMGSIALFVKLYTKRLKEKNIQLEETINVRTKTIVDQNSELEHKNKEITDSINYAQRIQKSLLASEQLLKKNLKNYFVFFQPKDIVSGDFYWGAELTNNHFALVTADSTGHGVPGAIMSMLNISCLNEAIEGQKLKQPAEILNFTRSKIIKHLSNDGSESGGKDGMDCSLICFDLDNHKFTYSAANNPIWVVRNNELIELKPDKMPVGKHDRDTESFNQYEFNLQKGDIVYTLTDGMPDQFGGPKGKKFMYKKLKELLVSISHLSMHEQKEKLNTEFTNWKMELEQVDDVLIIGTKV